MTGKYMKLQRHDAPIRLTLFISIFLGGIAVVYLLLTNQFFTEDFMANHPAFVARP